MNKIFINFIFFIWNKTIKKNFSENPLVDTANVTDEAPGKGITSILFSIHSLIIIDPGSEIPGVPASETIEMINPFFNNSITFDRFFFH